MEFREGMLGVVVVALALVGGMFASYFAGIEGEDREYTDYQYLADVSGLFDYDKSPTFIEFDPSSNYTGYYSEDTGEYWPEEYVDYVPNVDPTTGKTRVNNYRINLEPDVIAEDATADMNELVDPVMESGNYHFRYVYTDVGERNIGWDYPSYPITLANLLAAMGITQENTSTVRITLGDSVDWDAQPSSQDILNLNAVLFIPDKYFNTFGSQKWAYILNPNLNMDSAQSNYSNVTLYYPPQSLIINMSRGTATLYYDANWSDKIVSDVILSSILVAFGNDQQQGPSGHLNLSDTFTYSQYKDRPAEYLDPNHGVAMKE